MHYYKVYFDINDFEFWGGAADVVELCEQNDWMDELEEVLEEEFHCTTDEYIPTDTEINDFVHHEAIDRVEKLVQSRKDDEEDDDDDEDEEEEEANHD